MSQRFKCNDCKRTFTSSPRIPFEFIAFILYQKSWFERNGHLLKLKDLKKLAEQFLSRMDLDKKKISRRTLYYWINTYGESYNKFSHKKASQFVFQHQRELTQKEIEQLDKEYEEYMESTKPKNKDYLKFLKNMYGVDGAIIVLHGEWLKNKKKIKKKLD